jgi:hypothetical protein
MSKPSARQLLFALALVVLTLLALWLGLQDLAREIIRTRLLRALWVIYLVFQSIPPWLLWTALLTVMLLLARRSLTTRERPAPPPLLEEPPAVGPVAAEMHWLNLAAHSSYGRWRLAQRLAQLALGALAQRERLTAHAVRQALDSGDIQVPPSVRVYLRSGFGSPIPEPTRRLDSLLRFLRPPAQPPTTDRRPLQAIEFLEEILEEVKHDAD